MVSLVPLTPLLMDPKDLLLQTFFPYLFPVTQPLTSEGIPCEHAHWTGQENEQHSANILSKNPESK